MRFEHLIEINSPATSVNMVVPAFSGEQLWRGLLVKVHEPGRFPGGPDHCEVARTDEPEVLLRTLRFGPHEFHDRVELQAAARVVFTPEPHGDTTPVRLTLSVEEPRPALVVLRFVYESLAELSAEEAYYNEFRQNAWLLHDRDMVRTLRQWLSDGEL